MSRRTRKISEKTEQDLEELELMDDHTLLMYMKDTKIFKINGNIIHKVVVEHNGKAYFFDMKKIIQFLCEEVK